MSQSGGYCSRMQVFYGSQRELECYLRRLPSQRCSFCGASGSLARHGYIRGWVTPQVYGIRAWRIYCRPEHGGCARAPGIRTADSLLYCIFTAEQIWAFIQALSSAHSVKAAWESCGIPLSLDTGYRIVRRLRLCLPVIRTRLSSRAPPPEKGKNALHQMSLHLHSAFRERCPVSAYQLHFQASLTAAV